MRSRINLLRQRHKSAQTSQQTSQGNTLLDYIKKRLVDDQQKIDKDAYDRAKRHTENM